jgi:hypothetical protein
MYLFPTSVHPAVQGKTNRSRQINRNPSRTISDPECLLFDIISVRTIGERITGIRPLLLQLGSQGGGRSDPEPRRARFRDGRRGESTKHDGGNDWLGVRERDYQEFAGD